jgi:hypothetical protein
VLAALFVAPERMKLVYCSRVVGVAPIAAETLVSAVMSYCFWAYASRKLCSRAHGSVTFSTCQAV